MSGNSRIGASYADVIAPCTQRATIDTIQCSVESPVSSVHTNNHWNRYIQSNLHRRVMITADDEFGVWL